MEVYRLGGFKGVLKLSFPSSHAGRCNGLVGCLVSGQYSLARVVGFRSSHFGSFLSGVRRKKGARRVDLLLRHYHSVVGGGSPKDGMLHCLLLEVGGGVVGDRCGYAPYSSLAGLCLDVGDGPFSGVPFDFSLSGRGPLLSSLLRTVPAINRRPRFLTHHLTGGTRRGKALCAPRARLAAFAGIPSLTRRCGGHLCCGRRRTQVRVFGSCSCVHGCRRGIRDVLRVLGGGSGDKVSGCATVTGG